MSDLQALYQQIILEHQKHPRNFGELTNPTHTAEKENPLCGDQIRIDLQLEESTIHAIRFNGYGCAICLASTSIMTETISFQTIEIAKAAYTEFQQMFDLSTNWESQPFEESPDWHALAGVRKFPSRIRCASLGWETFFEAIGHPLST